MTYPSPGEAPVRFELPKRRVSYTRRLQAGDPPRTFFVTVGFYDDGTPGEVFADGWREGSDIGFIIKDACTVISLALQHGIPPEAMAHSLSKRPVWTPGGEGETWGSEIGMIVEVVKAARGEFGG